MRNTAPTHSAAASAVKCYLEPNQAGLYSDSILANYPEATHIGFFLADAELTENWRIEHERFNSTLAANAALGATTITVASVTNLFIGDRLSLGSGNNVEHHRIAAINTSTKVVTLAARLAVAYSSGAAIVVADRYHVLGARRFFDPHNNADHHVEVALRQLRDEYS